MARIKTIPMWEAETKPLKVIMTLKGHGTTKSLMECPFCGTRTWAYHWSLCGSGKRCENIKCRAFFGSVGAFDDVIKEGKSGDKEKK